MIEDRVRTMLHERSRDISAVPPALLALGKPPRRPHRVLIIAAAAAVVLAVAGAVLTLRGDPAPHRAPADGSCALPAEWRAAEQDVDLGTSDVLAVLGDGRLLVRGYSSLEAAQVGELGTLDVIGPDGGRSNLVGYASDAYAVLTAYPAGRTQFVLVSADSGFGMAGGDHPIPARPVYGIGLVDASTGDRRTIASAHLTDAIGGAAMLGDTVFWDVHAGQTRTAGTVYAYDIAEDRRRVVYSGKVVGALSGTATKVDWKSGEIEADLPHDVLSALGDDAVTDGNSYAAANGSQLVWAEADGAIKHFDQDVANTALVRAVAGPLVFFTPYDVSDEVYVLDSRTGAVADAGFEFPGQAFAHDGVVAFAGALASTAPRGPAIRLDTNGLPPLSC